MTAPLIGLGHDLLIGALVPFVVEPAIPDGVQNAQRDIGLDLSIYEQGLHAILIWPVIDGVDDLDALLAQMGLEEDSDLRTAVTAYLPTKRQKWHVYNAYANMPQTLNFTFWPTGLRIVFNQLVEIG